MTTETAPRPQDAFERPLHFGRFRLDPARKLLLDDAGRTVRLGGRALDLLVALVERAGEVVAHEELFARAWPDTVVEESSLRVHMSMLRKALGDGVGDTRYIASVTGRGYSFVMAVTPSDPPGQAAPASVPAPAHALPPRLTGIVGRERVLTELSARMQRHRLLTIVGPGGIGKTTVALELAADVGGRHAQGARFVDLATLADSSLVPAALAAALGLPMPAQSPWPELEAALAGRDLLIVLDNCEHVIADAAALAERVLRAAPNVRILATSREPLEAESEAIHRLDALEMPPAAEPPGLEDALAFPALRLFVERATASVNDFALTPANLPAFVRLCRHLDGLPLAIELAAARVGSLGIHALAERLDDLFTLLRRGRRTALPRHQTLQALLDWSHGLLEGDERSVLHRLSAFRSSFTLEAAADLASCERIDRTRVIACVLGLVSKSLVERETAETPRYRLLFVTRLYAADRLAAEGQAQAFRRRHAACVRDLLVRANAELAQDRVTVPAWLAAHAPSLPDIRAALAWAGGPQGDPALMVGIVVGTGRLALELGHNDEFLPQAVKALEAVRQGHAAVSPELELKLLGLLCMANGLCIRDSGIGPEVPARLDELSRAVGAPPARRAALQALCIDAFGRGDYPRVVGFATQFETLPHEFDDPAAAGPSVVGRRYRALGEHYLGDHRAAWANCAYVIDNIGTSTYGNPYPQLPVRVSMGIQQARILWLQGRADQASGHALATLACAEGTNPFGYSQVLALAVVPILLWRGDDDRAAAFLGRLVDFALHHFQSFWLAWSASFCRVLARRGHDVEALYRRLGPIGRRPSVMEADMLATLAPDLAGPQPLARVEAGTVGWCAPEVLRVHGDSLLARPAGRARAEPVLARALALARAQGALAWELRAATSLASLWHGQGQHEAAVTLLAEAVGALPEGRGDADVRHAQTLLARWTPPAAGR